MIRCVWDVLTLGGRAADLVLWAEPEGRYHDLGSRFQGGHRGPGWTQVAVLLGVLIGVGIGAWLIARYLQSREGPYRSPKRLFRELCREHKLNWNERRLLASLARLHPGVAPAKLFLEPDWFNSDNVMGPAPAAEHAGAFEALREKLFAPPRAPDLSGPDEHDGGANRTDTRRTE